MRAFVIASFMLVALGATAHAQQATPFDDRVAEARAAMMANPPAALEHATAAEDLAGQNSVQRATAQWLRGEALNRLNRPQEAAPVLDAALVAVAVAAPNTKLQGDLMMARAGAARPQGDYAAALANFQSAYDVFAALGEARSQAMALQQIGSIYTDARDYERALDYYRRAGEAYAGDPPVDLARLNNKSNALRELGRYADAEAGFREALAIAEQMGSSMLRARILTNIAEVQIAQGRAREADQTAVEALRLRPEGWEQFLWGVRAQAAFAQGNTARARELIERTFAQQQLDATTMPFREFHRTAYQIYGAVGTQTLALRHLEAFKRLDDEARDVAASANMALMGAQFDFASQELQISQLRTATLEAQVRQRTLTFAAISIIVLIILAALGYGYVSMRRSRNRVQKVNDQLNESNVALEKALKAKSEFLATTSHEIRTPLNGILGMTQVMLLDGRMDPDVRERVQLVHGAGESMRAIVDDILDVAKMENGGLTVGAEPFNPKAALEDVCRLWSANAEAKGLTFALDVSQCPSRLIGDEQRLRQVVFNLLSNAVKFTDAGHIALNARAEADHFVLDVADTGMGIPESEFDAIFTAFHQVDGATTRKHGGTGLGLSICRNLSRAMGGDVTVRSETGRGSTFTLRLPLPEAGEHVAAAANDAGPNVVAVDPNPMNGCLLEAFCAQAGYALHLFATADEAVARLSGNTAELVFLAGSALPNGPGEAMAALMAVREAAPGARLVVLLEPGAPIEGPAARLCGADEVLSGPFEAEAVLAPILAKAA